MLVCAIPDIRINIGMVQSIVLENEHTAHLKARNLNAFQAICCMTFGQKYAYQRLKSVSCLENICLVPLEISYLVPCRGRV
jgi:hypothetical protein